MNPRELRLRTRIDDQSDQIEVLTGQRDEARRMYRALAGRTERVYRHCAYCGTPCYGRACRAHSDLPVLERKLMGA